MEPTFVGSRENTTRGVIQEREGRGLRKEHPVGGTFGLADRAIWPTDHFECACENRVMTDHGPRFPHLLAVAGVAIIIAACGSPSPSPSATASPNASPPLATPSASAAPSTGIASPTADPATVYAQIEAQVQQIRGLTARTPVDPKLLDEAKLKANVTASFEKDNPPTLVEANERLYRLLGLIPAGASLKDLYLKLLSSQVAGYYDSKTKELYVVSKSGAIGPTEEVTFAHEFDHALQDQTYGLDKLQLDAVGESDRSLARLSIPEGDATQLMTEWAAAHLTPAQLVQMLQESSDPEQTRILAEMPDILKDTLLFPYSSGLDLVRTVRTAGGWPAVDALYAAPPASTEQVLHPDKYTAREAPIKVAFPKDLAKRLGTGWKVDYQDTLGEFQLGEWLRSAGKVPVAAAAAASKGWGGDRVALVGKGDTSGVVIDTRWDSPADAAEFAAAAQPTLDAVGGPHAMIAIDGTDRVTIFIATDDATINALGSALGLAG